MSSDWLEAAHYGVMSTQACNKLNVKQVAGLTSPGIYSVGGGLSLRVRASGTRSWLYVWMTRAKRREMGLGSELDVSLAEARQMAREARAIVRAGGDSIEKRRSAVKERIEKPSFGQGAEELIADIENGFRNAKHRKQWTSTIQRYAAPILSKPVDAVTKARLGQRWICTRQSG